MLTVQEKFVVVILEHCTCSFALFLHIASFTNDSNYRCIKHPIYICVCLFVWAKIKLCSALRSISCIYVLLISQVSLIKLVLALRVFTWTSNCYRRYCYLLLSECLVMCDLSHSFVVISSLGLLIHSLCSVKSNIL